MLLQPLQLVLLPPSELLECHFGKDCNSLLVDDLSTCFHPVILSPFSMVGQIRSALQIVILVVRIFYLDTVISIAVVKALMQA